MTHDNVQTKRLNEPEWEPKEIHWHRPGAVPEPGLYWFEGFVYFGTTPPIEGRYSVLILDDEWVVGMGKEDFSSFKAKLKEMRGEWYGPFECPPWLGETLLEDETEEGEEAGAGI